MIKDTRTKKCLSNTFTRPRTGDSVISSSTRMAFTWTIENNQTLANMLTKKWCVSTFRMMGNVNLVIIASFCTQQTSSGNRRIASVKQTQITWAITKLTRKHKRLSSCWSISNRNTTMIRTSNSTLIILDSWFKTACWIRVCRK